MAPASPTIGFGHLARQRTLAQAVLATGPRDEVVIVTTTGQHAQTAKAIPHLLVPLPLTQQNLAGVLTTRSVPDILVLDAPDEHLEEMSWLRDFFGASEAGGKPRDRIRVPLLAAFRSHGIDSGTAPFEHASLTPSFDEPTEVVEQTPRGPWRRLDGRNLLVVRPTTFAQQGRAKDQPARVLVTMGGADPTELTDLACEACLRLIAEARVTVIVGGLNQADRRLFERFGAELEVIRQEECDVDDLLQRSEVAVIAGGLTRYECVAARTPFVAVSATHAADGFTRKVVEAGFGVDAGPQRGLTPGHLAALIDGLLRDGASRERMRAAAATMIDRDATEVLTERLRSWRAAQEAVQA